MKLYSAIYDDFYPFSKWDMFKDYKVVMVPKEMEPGPGMLVVWGGEDISPSLYGKEVSHWTGATSRPSRRDVIEWYLMMRAVELGMPIIGICRGAQMLCALAGGKLYQHVNGHAGRPHKVVCLDGEEFEVSSLHHQMMNPEGVDHEMVARSKDILSDKHLDVDDDVVATVEPEFVYFPKVKGIAVQWHPEYMGVDTEANLWLKKWMEVYVTSR